MFFDNTKYFEFVKGCRDVGITVPIVPGLKILRSAEQLKTIPKNFFVDIPVDLSDAILENPARAAEIGKEWASKQTQELLEAKVPCVHYYVMNDSKLVVDVVRKFR